MSAILKNIDVILFDFGGVLIELDYPKVVTGFSRVARENVSKIEELVVTSSLLQEFEKGEISPAQFRTGVNNLLGTSMEDDEFDRIWNSMLKELPKRRMDILLAAGKRFHTYILSNANIIHEQAFNQMILETTGKPSLHEFVAKCYFSHRVGLRKPDVACYEWVCQDICQDPKRVLFLDDRLDNVEGARAAGLRALQITNADSQLKELFSNG